MYYIDSVSIGQPSVSAVLMVVSTWPYGSVWCRQCVESLFASNQIYAACHVLCASRMEFHWSKVLMLDCSMLHAYNQVIRSW